VRFHIDHRFSRCSLERFIAVYFSEHFNTEVAKVSGLRTRTLVTQTIHPDGRRDRRVRMHPQVTLPSAIKRFASEDQIHYDEVSSYDPSTQTVRYHIDSKANDRVTFKAPFGVGAVIEKFIEGEVAKGYEKIRPFLQRYLDEHPDGPPDSPPPVNA
jgi:hypothetical protein